MSELIVEFPAPTSYQLEASDGPRFVWIEASTKTGKTVWAFAKLFRGMCEGPDYGIWWWLAPSDKQARMAYERAKQWLAPLIAAGRISTRDTSPRRLTDTVTHSFIEFFTSANEDYIYGDEPNGVIVDEASRHKRAPLEEALETVIGPKKAWVWYIGNTKNRLCYHYRMCRLIEEDQKLPIAERIYPDSAYYMWTVWDAVEAGLLPRSEAEQRKRQFAAKGALHIWLRDYECRLDGVGEAFQAEHMATMANGERVESGAVIFAIDPGGKRHPAGLLLFRVGLDEDGGPRIEILHAEHWRGTAPALWDAVRDLSTRYRPDHWVTDGHMPLLTGNLEQAYGKGRVSHPRGTEARMWEWYETTRDLMAEGRIYAPQDRFPELWNDLEGVALDDEKDAAIVLTEYEIEEWDEVTGRMVTRVCHCDTADALLRGIGEIGRFVERAPVPDIVIGWI